MDQELQSQEQSVPELQEAEKRRKEPKNKKSYRFATILRWLSLHRQVWLVLLPRCTGFCACYCSNDRQLSRHSRWFMEWCY